MQHFKFENWIFDTTSTQVWTDQWFNFFICELSVSKFLRFDFLPHIKANNLLSNKRYEVIW